MNNNIYLAKPYEAHSDFYLHNHTSPSTTNMTQASGLSSPNTICSPLTFDENILQDLDLVCLLSPNSKASSLCSRSRRIQKLPIAAKETPKLKSKSSSEKKEPSKGVQKRKAWTPEEDEKLLSLLDEYGTHWAKIAAYIPERTGKQVRDRYLSVLVANINREPWTDEEDKTILAMLEKIGPQWSKIADSLKGRAEIQTKNRYYTYLKKYGIQLSNEEKLSMGSVEVTTEASPKGFDPTDMISYQSESVNADDLFFEWKKLGLEI